MKTRDIWFASDHHMMHNNIIKFTDAKGDISRTRRGVPFSSIEDHDEYLIDQHNSVVKAQDKVYFLGDFCINQKGLKLAPRFNGSKRLVRGNHDIFNTAEYINAGFKEVYGVRVFTPKDLGGHFAVCSHVPLHPSSLYRWGYNVHGHTHANRVELTSGVYDPRYISVCMEQLDDYRPLHIDELISSLELKTKEERETGIG